MPDVITQQPPKKPVSRGNRKKKTAKFLALCLAAALLAAGGIGLYRFLNNTEESVGEIFAQPATLGSIQSKVEYITFLLHNSLVAVVVHDFPRRLHTERRLEIRFRRFEITEHKYTRPRTNSNARCQLTAGKSDCLRFKGIPHRRLHGRKRV